MEMPRHPFMLCFGQVNVVIPRHVSATMFRIDFSEASPLFRAILMKEEKQAGEQQSY
jgi:hypothetical protein